MTITNNSDRTGAGSKVTTLPDETAKDTIARIKGLPTKAELEELMKTETVLVTFNKLDGEERIMAMTHNPRYIPEGQQPKGVSKPHSTNITGWCPTADGWRSCRYDRITQVQRDPQTVLSAVRAELIRQEIDAEILADLAATAADMASGNDSLD